MSQPNQRNKIRSTIKLVLWVLLVQIILINISAVFYGYRLTHFYEANSLPRNPSKNIFTKTWKLFTGPKFQRAPVYDAPPFSETVELTTHTNLKIEGWYIPFEQTKDSTPAAGTIILFHGLGVNKWSLLEQAFEYRFLGFNVMLVDLRAHGNSEGETTTYGVRESEEVKLAYDYIAGKGEKNIVLYGISLGAVVIAKAMYDYDIHPSGVILDAPFLSLKKHLQGRARILGFPEEPFACLVTFWSGAERGFNGFRHDVSLYAKKIDCRVLLQYGAYDQLVTPRETEIIYKEIKSSNKKLVIYPNAGHESFLINDPGKWRKEMIAFLLK